ncbi:MAG: helix-turn-helix domain-containing protein [Thermoplasmatales archaeon]
MTEEEILTVKEVAKFLKYDEHTIYRLARKGDLPGFKISGEWRFRKSVIAKWIEDKEKSHIVAKEAKNN